MLRLLGSLFEQAGHGYDVKNAAHCVRLLYTGVHLGRTGQLQIKLSGEVLDTVLQIKRRLWSFEAVQGRARALFDDFHAERDRAILPPSVEYAWADETVEAVIQATHQDQEAA